MSETRHQGGRGFWFAVFAVAATYGYFLLFAEFAFLKHVRHALGEDGGLRGVMGALGAGGIAGSVAALWRFDSAVLRVRLAWSYAGCAAMAALASLATGAGAAVPLAAGIGLALGWNTVTLAAGLRGLLPAGQLGWGIGCGTGAAYAFCNVPGVFTASAPVQAGLSAVLAGLAALAVAGLRPKDAGAIPTPTRGAWRWVMVFLALVWLDSAAFDIIQQTPGLRAATWAGSWRLWGNVGVHLVAALAAGILLDRGWARGVAGAAWLALAAACLALRTGSTGTTTGFLYAGGVSLYSTALVFFAAACGRPAVAAATFAIAGWLGSALGIGMAQDLHGVPVAFVVASGAAVVLALTPWRRGPGLVLAGLVLVATVRGDPGADLIARGREVYISEGCMHCHSQYVRPEVEADVLRWGPAHPLEEVLRGEPPLPGNRRQGPDLANVGNRRSPEWNRLHLQAPRMVSPGSRMPSYAHLFTEGEGRGEALVAYLASLGANTAGRHWETTQAWRPPAEDTAVGPAEAARLFRQHCAQCHGPEGRGDGPLLPQLRLAPPDWTRDDWRRVPDGDLAGLARLIKFGAPGTPMAGHETFTDAEILGLARQVKLLHR